MLRAATFRTDALEFDRAAQQLLDAAGAWKPEASHRAGLLFSSFIDDDHTPLLGRLARRFPGLELIGCAAHGEFTESSTGALPSLTLLLLASDTVRFAARAAERICERLGPESRCCLGEMTEALVGEPDLCLALLDGVSGFSIPLNTILAESFGTIPVVGGMASDGYRFEQTRQFVNERQFTGGAAYLGLGGDFQHAIRVTSGWSPIGTRHEVRTDGGNVVQRIGTMDAADFYRHYGGENPQGWHQIPLAVFEGEGDEHYLRVPVAPREDGSIEFAGTFPARARVQLAEVGREDLLATAERVNRSALSEPGWEDPAAALVFSCCSRKAILGSQAERESEYLLSRGFPAAGFFTYGELAPPAPGAATLAHHKTYVVVLLKEGGRSHEP